MKNIPVLKGNKLQSYIEFLNGIGNVRFGVEGKKLFYERDETKIYITDDDGRIVASGLANLSVTTEKIAALAVTAEKLAAALDMNGKTITNLSIEAGTPVNAVSSQGTLTLTGVVIDGETFIVGDEIFEIDTDGIVGGGNIAIDVSAFATASQGTLTVTGGGNQIADGDTVTIDTKIYTFKTTLTPTEGEILIGADDTAALLNLSNALDLAGAAGVDYSVAAIHPTVTKISSDALTMIVEVRIPGTDGDSIVSTEVAAELSWDGGGTLGTTVAGVDCPAADADGVIVTDVSAGSSLVTATQGGGTTVLMTVDIAGVAGNAFVSTVAMANGSFGASTLGDTVAGVDGTIGAINKLLSDATNLYSATAANTIVDANWKKLVWQSL